MSDYFERIYHHLEFDQIFSNLQEKCVFSSTRKRISKLRPEAKREALTEEFKVQEYYSAEYDHFLRLFQEMRGSLKDDPELSKKILSLAKGSTLSINDLYNICNQLVFYKQFKILKDSFLYNEELSWNSPSYQKVQSKFINTIKKLFVNDEFQPTNYPPLKSIWLKIQKLEVDIREYVKSIQSTELYQDCLQFSGHDLINDHYVLPIRSDRYKKEHGSIVSKSSQGLTLFVEPFEIRDLASLRIQLLAEYEEILLRLEREFSDYLRDHLPLVNFVHRLLLDFDYSFSKLLYGITYNGCFPRVSDNYEIKISDFKHPLIRDAVPNSVDLKEDKIGVLISGSNTGGKSVYLKTLALSHLFYKMGLMTPAKHATLPYFEEIIYFSSDRQNLEEGLSSFSSEVMDLVELLKQSNDGKSRLIFIDEIFSSTSSKEASALAFSLIEYLKTIDGIKLFISTHHEELKVHIHQDSLAEMLSASVLFNLKEKRPLYTVSYGAPGPSHAIEIFDNLVPQEFRSILDKAKEHLGAGTVDYEKVILELEKKNSELQKLIDQNALEKRQLEMERKKIQGQIQLEKNRVIKEYKQRLQKYLDKAFDLQKELKAGEKLSLKKLSEKSHSIKQGFFKEGEQDSNDNKNEGYTSITLEEIKEGDQLYSMKLGRKVTIMNINSKKKLIQVADKNFKAWVPPSDLAWKEGQSRKRAPQQVHINVSKEKETSVTLDARGMRLDEFQNEVEFRLQSLMSKDIPYLNIIHGHGEGILKGWLRKYLKNTKDFDWQSDKDHDGSTMIKLID